MWAGPDLLKIVPGSRVGVLRAATLVSRLAVDSMIVMLAQITAVAMVLESCRKHGGTEF